MRKSVLYLACRAISDTIEDIQEGDRAEVHHLLINTVGSLIDQLANSAYYNTLTAHMNSIWSNGHVRFTTQMQLGSTDLTLSVFGYDITGSFVRMYHYPEDQYLDMLYQSMLA